VCGVVALGNGYFFLEGMAFVRGERVGVAVVVSGVPEYFGADYVLVGDIAEGAREIIQCPF
jgi:hypothetical protein